MRILLAVSGGIDSMYLANRSLEDAGGLFGLENAPEFAVAHCNFALRGDESDADEDFVTDWCRSHGIRLHSRRFETGEYAKSHGISIEMAARDLRYAWFRELCRNDGYDRVAVAHNANDNAETLILNLLRGTGLRGLRGMDASGELILRPMLGISRDEIREWMESRQLKWREDSSNGTNEYRRNVIRNMVFPIFGSINPSFLETLNRDIRHFAQAEELANDYVLSKGLNPDDIDLKALTDDRHWKFILFRLTADRLNNDRYESLCRCIESGRQISGKRFGPYTATSDRLTICYGDDDLTAPEWTIVSGKDVKDLKNRDFIFLDASRFGEAPVFRHWKEGDWMIPLGMKGRKKISDIFNGMGLSIPEKKRMWLVEYPTGSSRIAAIEYGRIDDSMKVTSKTEHILKIKFKH